MVIQHLHNLCLICAGDGLPEFVVIHEHDLRLGGMDEV